MISNMKHSIYNIFIAGMLLNYFPLIVQAQGIHLSEGVHMVMQGKPCLVLDNAGITNNGNIVTDSGTVVFTGDGTSGSSSIGGNQSISFYNLRIDKSFNEVKLDNDIMVTGRVLMNQGSLQLNNHLLDLGSTGMISGESNHSFITGVHGGTIKIAALLNAPQAVNPGNIGVELTSPANLGLTVISRGHVQQTGSDGETSIQRYFEIAPAVNTGLDASLRFYYLDGELAGNNKNELSLFTSLENGNSWSARVNGNINRGDHSIMENHLDQLFRYTLAVGTNKGSNVTAINPSVRLYPNPTADGFTVMLYSPREKTEVIQLCDPLGHVLEQKEWHCQAGANSLQWNIGKYAGGVYLLCFVNPSLRNLQIVKQ
jgi:hypothetical protein